MASLFDKVSKEQEENKYAPNKRKVYKENELERHHNKIQVNNMNRRMNRVEELFDSGSMCTAKWLQATIYLMNGNNHSCHHPRVHKIPIDDLLDNPSAIHNTKFKKEQRQKMLDQQRPPECQYCWNVENIEKGYTSDRVYKSTNTDWSTPYIDRIKEAGGTGDVNPSYLEVAFDSTCNFKCMYCTPDISSKWMEEVEALGPYPGDHNRMDWIKEAGKYPIPNNKFNPYVAAFWKWWPDLVKDLQTFRITGGEPLLSKNTWKTFDYLIENPQKHLDLSINSNFCVPEQLFDKFMTMLPQICESVDEFSVYTSAEATGAQSNYIRTGMDYDLWLNNVNRFLESTPDNVRLGVMVTFNALSMTTFKDFLNDIYNLRVKYNQHDGHNRVTLMINYLRWPEFQNARLLPNDFKQKYINEIKEFVLDHSKGRGEGIAGRFYLEEIDQVNRLEDYLMLEADDEKELNKLRRQFTDFYREFDKRRECNFAETFPEYMEMFEEWSKL